MAPAPSAPDASTGLSRRADVILWAALAGLFVAWGASTLMLPFGKDQGVWAWIGDVVVAGGQPYRDAWETKGPLVFYLSAFVRGVLGRNEWGFRVFDLGSLAATLAAVGYLGRRLGPPRAAPFSVAFCLLWYTGITYWHSAQPDAWASTMIALAVAALATSPAEASPPSLGAAAAAGLLLGLATLIKPFYGAFLLLPLGWSLAGERRRPGAGEALCLATFAAPLAGCALWFAAHGALAALWEVHVVFNSRIHLTLKMLPWSQRLEGLAGFVLTGARALAVPLTLTALVRARGRERRLLLVVVTWAALAVAHVAVQGKGAYYHYTPILAPLAVLAGTGLAAVLALPMARFRRLTFAAVASASFGAAALGARGELRHVLPSLAARASIDPAGTRFGRYGHSRGSLRDVADYLALHTTEADTLAVWGFEPLLYADSGRRSASRIGFYLPMVAGEDSDVRRAARAEFVGAMREARPRYFVVLTIDPLLRPKDPLVELAGFEELRLLVEARYARETTIGAVDLYRRRDED